MAVELVVDDSYPGTQDASSDAAVVVSAAKMVKQELGLVVQGPRLDSATCSISGRLGQVLAKTTGRKLWFDTTEALHWQMRTSDHIS